MKGERYRKPAALDIIVSIRVRSFYNNQIYTLHLYSVKVFFWVLIWFDTSKLCHIRSCYQFPLTKTIVSPVADRDTQLKAYS